MFKWISSEWKHLATGISAIVISVVVNVFVTPVIIVNQQKQALKATEKVCPCKDCSKK